MIEVRNLSKTYWRASVAVTALHGSTFDIRTGEFVVIRGASGSGKSTLLNLLGCLDAPSSGTYRLDGESIPGRSDRELSRIRSQKIGFVFQSFNLLPRTTAIETGRFPLAASPFSHRRSNRRHVVPCLDRDGTCRRHLFGMEGVAHPSC